MTPSANQPVHCVTFRLTLACDLPEVRRATHATREFLAEQGLQNEEIIACELALAEACNNAIQYAIGPGRRHPVEVAVTCNGSKVELHVTDNTPGFDWPKCAKLPPPDSEHGRGVFIIQSLMDEATYVRGRHQNSLVMCKSRHFQGHRPGPSAPGNSPAAPQKIAENERTEMSRDLCLRSETLSAFFYWSAELGRTNNLEEFSQRLLTDLLHISSMEWFILRVVPKNELQLVTLAASEPHLQLPSLRAGSGSPAPDSVEVEAATTGLDVWFDLARPCHAADPLTRVKPGTQGLVRPFYRDKTLIGTLTVGRMGSQPQITVAQAGVVHMFADFLAVEIVNSRIREEQACARVVARELEIARNIQRALLPAKLPASPNFSLAGFYESARQVGGDFYDVIPLQAESLLLLIAEVMGKGVPAALFASTLRSLVRSLPDHASTPGELLARVNRQLFDDLAREDMVITAQLIFVDLKKRHLVVASAGHCPALLASAEGTETRSLAPEGMPLGVMAEGRFGQETARLSRRSRLLLYTDGVTETRNAGGESFGQLRLRNWLGTSKPGETAAQLRDALAADVRRFQGPTPLCDDQSFLLLVEEERLRASRVAKARREPLNLVPTTTWR
jgi:serine phosphatase RsbU (regulator of sigma subunit)/anti-sigma regulatory factor (Ser/Thr protein kinase)